MASESDNGDTKKITKEELENFAQLGYKISSKVIVYALMELVKHYSQFLDEKRTQVYYDRLITRIMACAHHKECTPLQLGFKETEYKLNMCLSVVPKDHKIEIDIPSDAYRGDIFDHIRTLLNFAVVYWKQFAIEQSALISDIVDALPDVDLADLKQDAQSSCNLFWCPNAPLRVGVFCYYVDKDGRPLRKS